MLRPRPSSQPGGQALSNLRLGSLRVPPAKVLEHNLLSHLEEFQRHLKALAGSCFGDLGNSPSASDLLPPHVPILPRRREKRRQPRDVPAHLFVESLRKLRLRLSLGVGVVAEASGRQLDAVFSSK